MSSEKMTETATVETRNLVNTISATGSIESAMVRTLASTIDSTKKLLLI